MPADQHADALIQARLEDFRRVVQRREQQILTRHPAQFFRRAHGAKGHFVIRRPDQGGIWVARQQLLSLLIGTLAIPLAVHQLAQAHVGMLGQCPLQPTLTKLRRGRLLGAGKCQQLHLTGRLQRPTTLDQT